ncbi:MAG TPA: NADP-dependent oxidoreductase [Anaerolineales bacterium]|nr:NADP-dependent oxidoreductase [Anaerolineales bacterium]
MKAVRIHGYGEADVLCYEEGARPSPGEGEVLIRVHATTANPFDCWVHRGVVNQYFHYTFPLVIGADVAGVIEEVGPGVTDFSPGDPVYGRTGIYKDGANAEYALAAAFEVARKPETLDYVHAAAVPHVVLIAWRALYELANLKEGQTVLIQAAAGGVGHIAVQLARLRGARVIGTASLNLDFLRELGVDEVIDYSKVAFEEVVKDVDVVLDLVGSNNDTQERSWKVLKPGGILVSTVQYPSPEQAAIHGVRAGMVDTAPPIGPTLTEVAKMIDAGQLKPHVSTVLPLQEIQTAHRLLEARHTHGKIVLEVVH